MFEFEDSKLGKVKVVNITEARSSIATIMNDRSYNYVITKNNKPIRVIINYEAYCESGLGLKNPTPEVSVESLPLTSVEKPIKNRIPGLLQSHENELMAKVMKESLNREEEVRKELEPQEPVQPKPVLEKRDPISQSVAHSQTQDPDEELADIVENAQKENYFEEKIQNEVSETKPKISPEEEKMDESRVETIQENNETKEELETKETVYEIEIPEEEEKSDYFEKFKKLYERPQLTSDQNQEPVNEIYNTLVQTQTEEETQDDSDYYLPEDDSYIHSMDVEPVIESTPEPALAPPSQVSNTPDVKPSFSREIKPKRKSLLDETPSIHDLLKELESEKLSDEDDSDGVDDILNKLSSESK